MTCVDCTAGTFASTSVAPLVVTITPTSVTLALPSDEPIVVDSLLDTVADDSFCTLREAITAANSDTAANGCAAGSGADTITFAVSGVIELSTRLPIITSDIEIDGTGADITLDGRGGSGTAILRINSGTVGLSNLLVFRGNEQSCPNLPTDPDNSTFCGAVLNYGTLNVSQVTFDRNQANNGAGAAIANRGATSILTVDRSTFTNQSTPFTGGITNWGNAVVSNSTFVNNGRASILNVAGATMDVVNSTFTATGSGRPHLRDDGGTLTLRNSIVGNPAASPVVDACEGTIIADSFNLATDGTCGGATTVTAAQLDLQPLADNGGPTETVGLGLSSVAIDAGDDTVCSAAPVGGVDQRGLGRPFGPSCDSGAFEAITPTFTNLTPDAAWGDPANWSTGVVPGPTDAAIIPAGANVRVFGPGTTTVGSLTLAGNLDVDPFGTGLRFEILGDSVIEASGSLFVTGSLQSSNPYTNTFALSGELQVDGSFGAADQVLVSGVDTLLARSTPVVELNDGASFSGDGSVLLLAQFVKNGLGTVTFGPDLDVDLDVDSTFDIVRGTLEINAGTLDIQSAAPNGSFVGDGTIAIGPGTTVNLPSGTTLGSNSVVDIGIDGSSSNALNYGRLVLPDGASAGTLSTTFTSSPEYTPTIFDRYPVVDCGAATCVPFPSDSLGGSLGQLVNNGDLVLGLSPAVPTFINPTAGAAWGDPANWSTGVVPSATDAATIPAGADVTVSGSGTTSIGSLTLAGTLRLDTTGTGRTFEILGDSVIESGGLLDITGAIDEDVGFPGTATLNTLALERGPAGRRSAVGGDEGHRRGRAGLEHRSRVAGRRRPPHRCFTERDRPGDQPWRRRHHRCGHRRERRDVEQRAQQPRRRQRHARRADHELRRPRIDQCRIRDDHVRRQHDPASVVVADIRRRLRRHRRDDQHAAARLRALPRRRSRPDVRTHRARHRRGLHRCRTDHDLHLHRLRREPARPGQGRRVRRVRHRRVRRDRRPQHRRRRDPRQQEPECRWRYRIRVVGVGRR